jgi:hypothetical protein
MWERLDHHCRQLTGNDEIIAEKQEKIEALEAKIKEYEKKGKA